MAGEKHVHKFDLGSGNAAFILSDNPMRPVKTIEKITPQSWAGRASGGQKLTAIKMLNSLSFLKDTDEKGEPAAPVKASVAEHLKYIASNMDEE